MYYFHWGITWWHLMIVDVMHRILQCNMKLWPGSSANQSLIDGLLKLHFDDHEYKIMYLLCTLNKMTSLMNKNQD